MSGRRRGTRVIDAERSAARFADAAGYTNVKTEITQVTGYLRDPPATAMGPGRADRLRDADRAGSA